MNCRECGADLPANAKFCTQCGAGIHSDNPLCPSCGGGLKPGARFCQICGAPQTAVDHERALSAGWGDVEVGSERAGGRNLKYILLPLVFVPFLAGIFYLLSFQSQNPESSATATAPEGAPDMSQMMPVFRTIDSLRTVLQQNPQDTTALLVLGEMYEIAGKFPQAREYYQRYLTLYPEGHHIKLRVLGTLISEHKHEEEEQLLAAILQMRGNEPNTLLYIGDLYERAQKLDKARDFYQRAMDASGSLVDVYMRLAGLDFAEKNYAAAEAKLEKVLQEQPDNPHALYNYALALHMHGEHEKAVTYWQKAAVSDPNGNIGRLAREALVSFGNMNDEQ